METTERKVINEVSETTEGSKDVKTDLSAENTLKIIAVVVLVVGVIATLVLLVTIVWVDSGRYSYSTDIVFNPAGFATTLAVFLSTLISWASLKVLADISINLKEINSKM